MESQRIKVSILWVLLAALFLRIILSMTTSFDSDEAFSYFLSRLSFKELFSELYFDRHPPFFYLLHHFLALLTSSSFILRIPALGCSAISLVLIFLLGRELFREKQWALWAAILYGVAFGAWHLDFRARMYAPAQLFQLLATLTFLKFRAGNRRAIWMYILSMTAAVYTLYFSTLIFLAHGLTVLLLRDWKTLKTLIVPVGILLLPLAYFFHVQTSFAIIPSFWFLKIYSAHLYPWFLGVTPFLAAYGHVMPWTMPVLAWCGFLSCILFLFQVLALQKWSRENRAGALLLGCMFVTHVIGILLLSQMKGVFLRERYFYLFFPYFILILITVLKFVSSSAMKQSFLFGFIGLNLVLFAHYSTSSFLWGENMKPIADKITKDDNPSDLVAVSLPPPAFVAFNYFFAPDRYRLQLRGNRPSFDYQGKPAEYYVATAEDLEKAIPEKAHFRALWLVVNQRRYVVLKSDGRTARLDSQQELLKDLMKRYALVFSGEVVQFDLNGEDVDRVYEFKGLKHT